MLDFTGTDIPAETQAKLNEQVSKAITGAVEKEVGGLRAKNEELLGNFKGLQEKLKAFDGIDPEATRALFDKFSKAEEQDLLKSGNIDGLVNKRLGDAKIKHDDEMKTVRGDLEKTAKERDSYKGRYESYVVRDVVGKFALESKAHTTALDDIARRAMDIFKVNEKGELEARGEDGSLLKTETGDLLTPQRFIESLKKAYPHYWPGSTGAGLDGDVDGTGNDIEDKMAKAAEAGDMKTYNRLREARDKARKSR